MIVRKHMSAPPITVSPKTDFKVAMGLMQQHRIRRLPVVDSAGLLTGIVAERDLLSAADRYLQSIADVDDVMTRRVVTVECDTPVIEAASLMIGLKIGGLPVVDAANKVLGIITETDLLKALIDMLAEKKPVAVGQRSAAKKKPAKNKASRGKTATKATRKTRARKQPRRTSAKGQSKTR